MTLQPCSRKSIYWFAVLLFSIFSLATAAGTAIGSQLAYAAPGAYTISDIKITQAGKSFVLKVSGSSPPTYTMYELFEPQRLVLDIADGSFGDTLSLPLSLKEGPVVEVKGKILDDKEPKIARLELMLKGEAKYTVERDINNILVSFKTIPSTAKAKPAAKPETITAEQVKKAPVQESVEEPVVEVAMVEQPVMVEPAEERMETLRQETPPAPTLDIKEAEEDDLPLDDFGYAGYDKQPVTVDFYKIDIHNVFRLFGEISGMNIVIDQGVSGNLTLSLQNVPWDFVLDLILNMKQLQAEERFNTLVISPKSKAFDWPERKPEALAVKQDKTIMETTKSITVEKREEITPEIAEAQKLIHRASLKEKQQDYEDAIDLYERAFENWPANRQVANRLASLYLVHLGMNAKAVHFGKAALKVDKNDHDSALYTAIGLANMNRTQAAKEYFDTAVSGEKAASEALLSYAMFSEENQNYLEALLLLARHEDLYGDSLDTLVAKARIYDKEGNGAKAVAEYRAILLSGYPLPSDLKRYINGRLALEEKKSQ